MSRTATSDRWAIVGGGFLGMTLALRLAQAGKRVTLFESADRLGGLASAWHLDDVVWDRHYHVTLLSDTCLRSLLGELGVEKDMQWVQTRTGFFSGGQLLSMSNTLEFLRFPPLNIFDKLRLGATIFYASRVRDWKRLENIEVATWLKRLSGRRTFERIWLPLLRSKLGESYRETSAAFIWATIARMYAARRTGLKKEMFGYVPGGYARVLERFGEVLNDHGVEIRLGTKARRIAAHDDGSISVETDAQAQPDVFDRVVVTAPGMVAADLCDGLTGKEKALLAGVRYQGIICASLLLKKPLAEFYVTNITDEGIPFTGVIEMSALVDRKHFGGNALVYLPKYVAPDDSSFEKSDDELREMFVAGLERMYPNFSRGDITCFRISRVRHVFPLATIGYSDHLPSMSTSVPGLYVINSAHIVNGTLNVNETVQLAEKAVSMLKSLPQRDHGITFEPEEVLTQYEDEATCQPVAGP